MTVPGLAAERTALAWQRTAVVLCAVALAIAAIVLRHERPERWLAAVAVLASAGTAAAVAVGSRSPFARLVVTAAAVVAAGAVIAVLARG